MPTLLTAICVAPVSLATLVIHLHLNGNKLVRGLPGVSNTSSLSVYYDEPSYDSGAICLSLLHTIVALPIVVITNRSTITPYRLHLFNPALALRILLTPTERRRPWRLYLTPGLFLSQFIHLLLFLALRDMRLVFIPDGIILGGPSHSEIIWWKVAFFAVMFVQITIMFLVPLEVRSQMRQTYAQKLSVNPRPVLNRSLPRDWRYSAIVHLPSSIPLKVTKTLQNLTAI